MSETQPTTRANPTPLNTSSIDVTAMLLLIQAGIGLISWIGTIVLGIFMGAPVLFAVPVAVGSIGVVLPLLFARGILRLRRKARTGVIVYQTVILLALIVRLIIGGEYAVGLLPLLTSGVLPLTILGIMLSRSCRRAFAKQRRPKHVKTKNSPVVSLDPAGGIEQAVW